METCIVTTPIRPKPTVFPPFGSMAIIQSLRNDNKKCSFYNIDYHRYDREEVKRYLKEKNYDIIGISAVVSTAYEYTKFLCETIRSINPNTIIIVGGGLCASAEVLHRKSMVDYCVIGDGEIIIKNLVNAIIENRVTDEDLLKIKGITFIDKKDKFRFTGYGHPLPAPLLEEPDFEILREDNSLDFFISPRGGRSYDPEKNFKEGNSCLVIVAKGCVARCSFCHRFEKGYRVNPLEKIKNHLIKLRDVYNVRYISIGDENFGSYKEETKELAKMLGELGFVWTVGGVRAHTVDYESLKLWRDNGCEVVLYGIESGSEKMLKVMEKKITRSQNIQALKDTYDAGLSTVIQLVIGMPGETDETIEETIDFLIETMKYYPEPFRKNINYLISINYAQSLPGTPLYEYARENGYLEKSLDAEEKYLISISDKDAYDNEHFINFTQQPLLKVLSWRYWINWKIFREHVKQHLKIDISKSKMLYGFISMVLNKFFKIKIKSELEATLDKYSYSQKNPNYNFQTYPKVTDALRLLIPWNKYTYPFILLLVAYKESMNVKWFFKMIFEHIVWSSKKFNQENLPSQTLRKTVTISDDDETVEIRKGR